MLVQLFSMWFIALCNMAHMVQDGVQGVSGNEWLIYLWPDHEFEEQY